MSKINTNKANAASETVEMRSEYDFRGGIRGKYVSRLSSDAKAVVLDPDVARAFPDATSVNRALRELLPVAAGAQRTE